ncbi:tRNA (adenosine(37)-N6)-threonylcarbamoyltransferase complex transferase subunit TsaD [Candidatus Atelocyanobacterium thalassae]|uniref:tRNA N6-adenosine threonylcarbamoyltransferase n=1 Tax=cyanobacterium endosymbiont of Braarudosphaera bigelowii TaxID=1285375 RepID=A0ABM7U5R7_9CHRO|nr:tRNA (adenosine(37)-N6)-threonylcarbamoyltransferase complex transferase subunit TsaD [Candidatus Atelocyanobacterium thalassa]BDA40091.1 tRNA N6-adenosine threonylcarbamoyltransferase [cyanobacterium endosymbiont of Braarudosphaera bigelowii]
MVTILAIETSCDDTSVAIVNDKKICSNVVASQNELHSHYGGIVPEVASREHLLHINYCIEKSLQIAKLNWNEIDGIAATVAPGLVGALIIGETAAKTLSMIHDKPFLGIHHLEGHIYANYLCKTDLEPPFLCLLVSGGHTSLIHVKDYEFYEELGKTRDDAAGEAFDKVARLLDLGYPGGPIIDKLATTGNPKKFNLPEGRISLPQGGYHPYDSSFSGLKTAVLRLVEKFKKEQNSLLPVADIAASFQETIVRSLTKKTIKCAIDHNIDRIAIGGGVAANSGLRNHLTKAAKKHNLKFYCPPFDLCTDNAAMIACAAANHLAKGRRSSWSLQVQSRLKISETMKLYQ